MKKKIFLIIIILLLIAACLVGFFSYERKRGVKTNEEVIPQSELFDVNGNEAAIIYDFSLQSSKGIVKDGRVYLPLGWVRDYINDKFYWDESINSIIYTLPEDIEIFRLADEENSSSPRFVSEKGDILLSMNFVASKSSIYYSEFTGEEAHRVYINDSKDAYDTAEVTKDTRLRTGESSLQRVIIPLSEGDRVRIISQGSDGWTRILTESGFPGYMETKYLDNYRSNEPVISYSTPLYSHILMEEEVIMVWNQLDNTLSNNNLPDLLERTSGINVISPTWFSIVDNSGGLKAIPSHDYVTLAHDKGLQVWALIDNFSTNINSTEILSSWNTRQSIINQLINYASEYDFDGINVDFENLEEKCGAHFVEFIRELSVSCRKEGLVLSVDNPNMQSFNAFYGRDAQAECADYVINMGYDEHYSGGDAGSVASLPFVNEGIQNCLSQVPAGQLINGIPFYTRIWILKDGKVTSQAVGLETAQNWVNDNDIELSWDEELGQNRGNNEEQYIWMEDRDSLSAKIDLCRRSGLAGMAGWKLGMESPETWDLFTKP
ncbi:MAG: hypothetical protein KBS51_06630 [Lachnospiraceae bacterium]|nr:hypothetical protein [Candidatus Darwinimomas equi]